MSKSKSDLKRFVTVFQTDKSGKFKFEFREVTKDDIRTVAYIKEASWEEISSAINKFMHGGDVDLSKDLFSSSINQGGLNHG